MLPSAVSQLLPTPTSRDHKGPTDSCRPRAGSREVADQRLLPTPTTMDSQSSGGGYNGQTNVTLTDAVVRGKGGMLLPTPSVADGEGGHLTRSGDRSSELLLPGVAKAHGEGRLLPTPMVGSSSPAAHGQISGQYREQMAQALQNWGAYADAVARWEAVLGRPAPPPTQPSRKGTPQLSPRFSEWLMGLPDGWVTDVPGITRNEALRALGNGVVPQQAAAALRYLLDVQEAPA